MAAAVGQMFPETQFGVGPVIENGCYYDFVLPRTLIPEDLPLIENKIKEMLKQPLVFKVQEVELQEAIALFEKMNQPLKVELLQDLATRGTTSMSEEERADFEGVENDNKTSSFNIRKGNPSDIPSIVEIKKQGWQDITQSFNFENLDFLDELKPEEEKKYLEKEFFVIEDLNKNILGSVVVGQDKEIHEFFVSRNERGKGIGKQLLKFIIKYVYEKYGEVKLGCLVDNSKALNFYKSFGFEKVGVRNISVEIEGKKYFADEEILELVGLENEDTIKLYQNVINSRVVNTPKITIYRLENEKTGEDLFVDLCKGPHVLEKEGFREMRSLGFSLDKFSASYWRGDQKRDIRMQRLYALVFDTKEELKEFEEKRKLAQERDHKKIGAQAEWFYFDETAPGMPYFLPKGLIIKNKLIEFWRQDHLKRGYQEYSSPLISKQTLFETSGHWEHYRDDMMITKSKGEDIEWGIKAMSCPNACNVYAFKSRSYKELPLRFSDLDTLHRNENPGSLNGLFRVRCFNQDDSHNFIRPDQVEFEINNIIQIIYDFYKLFNLENDIKLYLSTMPDDHLGEEEDWRKAENIIEGLLKKSDFDYGIKDKDGAFYGPKIDIHLTDALGRDWQCGTVQLDYQLPTRFNLWYTDENGEKQRPVIIHRVIYGSLDRFLGILIEHTGGRLPFWLAPVQIKILTINNEVETMDYVAKIRSILDETVLMKPLKYNELRYEVDDRNESLGKKIREATKAKIPVQLIVGPKDISVCEVSVRTQEGEEKVKLEGLKEFLQQIK
jgi:threonyl-tRNA synthetase